MALSSKILQRKREKKNKKRSNQSLKVESTVDYSKWPIYECWVPTELWTTGIGSVIVTRKSSQDDLVVGIYLLDVFCLGIKDCFIRLVTTFEYQNMLVQIRESCGNIESVSSSYASTLIRQAKAYGHQLGFKPQGNFLKASRLLRDIPFDDDLAFTFGKEGKPCYIPGPYESERDVKKILKTLERKEVSNLKQTMIDN